ncbi:hypothetical protein IP98_02414 [Flavobacterium cauense R2A-7]|uniref:Uncharacterized protein n=1 Tax=Flavobacterium cauense R2A-7 TaxID=1341154 RepID=A0A562LRD9_9FLAO|nr:hypothetical protein IP98_02414 [Flavobacterium cauense R2A-7]
MGREENKRVDEQRQTGEMGVISVVRLQIAEGRNQIAKIRNIPKKKNKSQYFSASEPK